jgi:hypothetical protein
MVEGEVLLKRKEERVLTFLLPFFHPEKKGLPTDLFSFLSHEV